MARTPNQSSTGTSRTAESAAPPTADGSPNRQRGLSGRPYGGRPLSERMAERRARFIAAGSQTFGTVGLRAATVRGLCHTAGLTDRYFYESFDSLEALLEAVYRHQMDRYRQRLIDLGIPRPLPGEDQWAAIEHELRQGAQTWFTMVSDPSFARVVLDEVLGVSERLDALFAEHTRQFAALTLLPAAARLPRLQAHLDGPQGETCALAVTGPGLLLAKMWAAGGYREPMAALVDADVQVVLGAVQRLDRHLADAR